MKRKVWKGLAYSFAFLTALGLVAGQTMESYSTYVDNFFNCSSSRIVSEEGETYTKFTPNTKYLNADGTGNSKALIADAIELGRKIGAEGTVLLKNDGTLPLKAKSAVTLLGARGTTTLLGAGMGVKANGAMITLADGLSATSTNFKDPDHVATYYNRSAYGGGKGNTVSGNETMDDYPIDGAGFTVNPVTLSAYKKYNDTLGDWTLTNNDSVPDPSTTDYNPQEPSLDDLKAQESTFESSFASYNDAAIVVVGRPSSESNDYWKGDVAEGLGCTEPLQLTQNEKDIIDLATKDFSNVVVLINSASPMDIDELKNNDKIGAICYIGQPGVYGLLGVAQVLAGKESPSGKLPDTWAANQLSAPATMNMGEHYYSNKDQMTRSTSIGGGDTSKTYIMEAEGIYTGYKYYETRYEDQVLGVNNANSTKGVYNSKGGWDYDSEVSYAFGYGESYTTFTQTIESTELVKSAHEYKYRFNVKVTNTGSVAGKDVVQIYGQAPYTKGGIEKSSIQLIAFDKTETLEPGASQTLTIEADLQNLASYDMDYVNPTTKAKGTYVLEKGDYYLSLGNGAHEALNNVLTVKGAVKTGDVNSVYKFNIASDDHETFSVSKNNTYVSNQLEYADWNYYDPEEKVTYLSRSDWDATYPKEYANMKASDKLIKDLNGLGDEYYHVTASDTSDITWGKSTTLKLADMYGADWDDSRWDEILDALTLDEAEKMIMYGGPNLAGADSITYPTNLYLTENSGSGVNVKLGSTKDPDAPWSISSTDNNAGWDGGVFANATTTAATYNPALWYELGEFIGEEALFTGITFLWGPGLNTHRHSYNGRTGEYYSEDGVLAGDIAMEYANGAIEKGLIAAPKHFAFNDQETHRAGVAPYMTEQRARETELRAYQIAVESDKYDTETHDAGMRGVMTSFSKIGGVEVTCSYGLMTNILQNEWGFHGYAVTDIWDDTDLFSSVAASGVTCYDSRMYNPSTRPMDGLFASQAQGYTHSTDTYKTDGVLQQRMKLACKNIIWVTAQSSMMNRFTSSSHTEWIFTPWRAMYIIGSSVFGLIAVAAAAMYVFKTFKDKEGE